jgi:hypothetical protein
VRAMKVYGVGKIKIGITGNRKGDKEEEMI